MQVILTERAATWIRELIAARGESVCMRLLARRQGAAVAYDLTLERAARKGDAVVQCGDLQVLVDPASAELAGGCSIDFLGPGVGFAIHNPKAGIMG